MKVLILLAPFLLGLAPGEAAPDFTAVNQDGKSFHLADLRGKFVLLYFYPKDDTAGCTAEAQSFRDHFAQLKKLGVEVLGVSRQDAASHKQFIAKNSLPFDLLVDADGKIGEAFGVPVRPYVNVFERQSVLLDPSGKVARFYGSVDPGRHAGEVIADVQRIKKEILKRK